jgi:ABC-2 type transport system permease protein
MRLFAEEKRHKTFELLMTAPLRPTEIVLGKYLGGVGVMGTTLGLTIAFPLVLQLFGVSPEGQPVLEWSTVLLGYGAILLWGATCIAVGMFLSSLTQSQMLAALLTIVVLVPWWALSLLSTVSEPWRGLFHYLSFSTHLQELMKGVLDVKALVFFASVIFFSLLLTHRTVEAQRWT